MQTIEERLAATRFELTRQQAEWDEARAILARLGGTPLRVPVAALAAIDALVHRAHAAAGAVAA